MSKVTVLDFRGKVRTMDRKYADILCAIGKAEYVDDAQSGNAPTADVEERSTPQYERRVLSVRSDKRNEQYETKQGRRERGRGR